jgi:dTDP-4-dehydrorhamnose 3,5-epimerase
VKIEPLRIEGAWLITPDPKTDDRGTFLELYRGEALTRQIGHPLHLAQANLVVSGHGVIRGVHYADVPPGQAKYVTCAGGEVIDVIVDLRIGSPTFGESDQVRLDDLTRQAVYLSEGLGHGYVVRSEAATMVYLCSTQYNPAAERGVSPLDPALGINWTVSQPVISDRDRTAPTLAEAAQAGHLPTVEACRAYRAELTKAAGGTEP